MMTTGESRGEQRVAGEQSTAVRGPQGPACREQSRVVLEAINGGGPHAMHSVLAVSTAAMGDAGDHFADHKFRLIEKLRETTAVPVEVGDAWMARILELDPDEPQQGLLGIAQVIGDHAQRHRESALALLVRNAGRAEMARFKADMHAIRVELDWLKVILEYSDFDQVA